MTAYRIPTSTDPTFPSYTQRTTLDGREYVLGFDWNARDLSWYFSISDEDGAPILVGRKIVLDYPLLDRLVDDRAPPGAIVALDLSGRNEPPQLDDLGTRVILYYYDAASLAEAS